MGIEEFKEALGADEVIENFGPKGPLNIMQSLALRAKFDERRRRRAEEPTHDTMEP